MAETLDDVMYSVVRDIIETGKRSSNTKGESLELTGVMLEITNPRSRISRSEMRGKPFGCLGELCWYLARSRDLQFISYYLPRYKEYADGKIIWGGYGTRLFDFDGQNQFFNVIDLLRRKSGSRRAVIQLFDHSDLTREHNDIPCTCSLQFLVRDEKLQMLASMRSNDAYWGLPHDVFAFTMLQEIMARTLSIEVGIYKHFVGSLHIYTNREDEAREFLEEGFQSTKIAMPPMPIGDPWPSIAMLLDAESKIRLKLNLDERELIDLNSYWLDLVRILQILRLKKDKEFDRIRKIESQLSIDLYDPYVEALIRGLDGT